MPEAINPLWTGVGWQRLPGRATLSSKWQTEVWNAGLGTLPPGFTFTRTGTAMRLWGPDYASAQYEIVAQDTPRFERLPDGSIGLLIEGARTNIHPRFDGLWIYGPTTDAVMTPKAASSPDGQNNAGIVELTTGDAYHYAGVQAPPATYTASLFHKNISGSPCLRFSNTALGTESMIKRMDYPNWRRESMTLTPTGSAVDLGLDTRIYLEGNALPSVSHVWGAQIEVGPFASSPIPNLDYATTRNSEQLTKAVNPADFDEFTVFLDIYDLIPTIDGMTLMYWAVCSADGSTCRMAIFAYGTAVYFYHISPSEAGAYLVLKAEKSGSFRSRFALRRKADGIISGCCDGGAISDMPGSKTIGDLAVEGLGQEAGTSHSFAHIIQYARHPYAMNDTQMVEMTRWKPEEFIPAWKASSLEVPPGFTFTRTGEATRWWD